MADFLNGIFISEILADNAGSSAIDTDNDGNTNKADEFIEIVNASGETISLDGYQLWSEKNGLLFTFPSGSDLASGDAATVVGNYSGTPPAGSGFYSAGIAENGNFLPDGEGQKFDSIFLVDTNTGDYIVLSYGQPPRAPTLPTGFTGTNQVGAGESINSNAPNGTAFARDTNGDFQETSPTPDSPNVACFTQDTMILTQRGERAVCDVRVGDMIPTFDHGNQPVLGICTVHFPASTLLRTPALRPLTVGGAPFGTRGATRLSPAHCLLLKSPHAEAFFGASQVLLRARHLQAAGLARADIPRGGVTYYHLLFADHTLIMADGFWSESFLNAGDDGAETHTDMGIWRFADGVTLATTRTTRAARIILRKHEARVLLDELTASKAAQPTPRDASPSAIGRPKLALHA